MMSPLDMKYVYKRKRYLEKTRNISENSMIDTLSNISDYSPSSTVYRVKVENFIKSDPSYQDMLGLLEMLYSDDRFTLLESATSRMISDIIPAVPNKELPSLIASAENAHIGDINRDRLVEAVKMYKSIDRIIKNHKILTEKFGDCDSIFLNRAKSDKSKCYTICEFVDTYTVSPFIKMNIALEEITYRKYTDGLDIPEKIIAENVTNYFLLRDSNTNSDIEDYKRCIKESKVLSEDTKQYIPLVFESSDEISQWKLKASKTRESLEELVNNSIGNIKQLESVMELCNDFSEINSLDYNADSLFGTITEANTSEAKNLLYIIQENHVKASDDIIKTLESIYEEDINTISYSDDKKTEYPDFTSSEIDSFKMRNLITDAKEVGEFLDHMEKSSMKESPLKFKRIKSFDDVELNESNICDYVDNDNHISINLRSYTYEGAINDIYEFAESTQSCINNILHGRNSYCYYSINENNIDFSVRTKYFVQLSEAQMNKRSFAVSDKNTILEMMDYRDKLQSIQESSIDILMELLNDRDLAANIEPNVVAEVAKLLLPYTSEDNNIIDEFVELCNEEANPGYDYMKYLISTLDRTPFNIDENHTEVIDACTDKLLAFAEAKGLDLTQKMAGNLKNSVEDVKKLNPLKKKNKVSKEEASGDDIEVSNVSKSQVKPKKVAEDDDDEEEDEKQSSDNKKQDKEDDQQQKSTASNNYEKKYEGGDINLNDAKLAWKAAQGKMKKAGAKEQEICHDIDMVFNRMCGSIDDILAPNAREAAITGQVNRSITDIVKLAIALCGVGAATGAVFSINPIIVPAFTAITMFAKSKYISKKEKAKVLDQIDVELKVLDRELSRAESSGSPKKYRQLLTIQKELQRRRQQIYFQLGFGGKKIPLSSKAGLDRD